MNQTYNDALREQIQREWDEAVSAYLQAASWDTSRDSARTRLYELAVIRGAMQPIIVHHHTPTTDKDMMRGFQMMAEAAHYDHPGTTPLVGPYGA